MDPTQHHEKDPHYYEQPTQEDNEANPEQRGIPKGFSWSLSDMSLLLIFGKHVACRFWSDAEVSIIVLFYLITVFFTIQLLS